MRLHTWKELVYLDAMALVLALIILLGGPQPLRVALGLPFVLFLPGYCLIAALFPRQGDLDGIERIALSFGLSIAVVPLIGLGLNYTPWGIRLYPILISLLIWILGLSALGLTRRRRLPPEERFTIALELKPPAWRALTPLDRVLSIVLIAAIIFAVGSIVYVVKTPKVGERFTEFYILGPSGNAEGYPRRLTLGESGRVILGIVNHEYARVEYRVTVRQGTDDLVQLGPLVLNHEEKWEEPLAFTPRRAGENQKIEFLLYKTGETPQPGIPYVKAGDTTPSVEPYRSLHLWINVVNPSPANSPGDEAS
ncbi:hypothetical protein E308F_08800 [Moorella sp. E308F]|uniref:DUF1616 domain-containing protein n=1 Tax=Moorella sp. E308F TaxID=2572682 RepID=UPI0010FFC531|nr:DUF1616 domain-containing protein [Moorella sp. E308F]GEA14638.1 hypothetical protein E308F_08800 [Moorella sp. E308F]